VLINSARRDPSTPLITYYDDNTGERTELSTTSMLNWQAKTANLLRDSYGLSTDSTVGLFLPTHWLVPVFVGAVAAIGATLVLPDHDADGSGETEDLDLAVVGPAALTSDLPSADDYLACSLRPMAAGFTDALPMGIDDYSVDVRAHGDFFANLDDPTRCPTLRSGSESIDSTEMPAAAQRSAIDLGISRGDRVLVTAGTVTVAVVMTLSCVAGSAGSTNVIVEQVSSERLAAIKQQEKITVALSTAALNR
jgi:uncharacterized protein (TIGR03089 family)